MEINYIHTENIHNTTAASEVLPYLFSLLKPDSVADVGCGTGSWLSVAKKLGASRILGVDGVHVDKELICINNDEFLHHNLVQPLTTEKKYDLAMCLEVAEHLPPEHADDIITTLIAFSDVLLFAAAIPGQGGQFHLNEQWPEYWRKKLAAHDYFPFDILRPVFWDNPKVEWWYRQNMFLYIKKGCEVQYNLTPTGHLPVYIHPELFNLKLQAIDSLELQNNDKAALIQTEIIKPSFFPTLKRLIKSLTK